jgi:NAD-dependent SIR2 family protein deacetylase
MVVDSGKILFFFGAGASAEFGIPTMKKMAEEFKIKISQQKSRKKRSIYNDIIRMLKDDIGQYIWIC